MRPFAAVERFFERLFERPSARLFHSPLQPVQIQRRLERALDSGRVMSDDRAYVPNQFDVVLNPQDAQTFEGIYETLEVELADSLHARARARGYRLLARPVVAIHVSSRIRRGDIQVDAEPVNRKRLKQLTGGAQPGEGPRSGNGSGAQEAAHAIPPLTMAPVCRLPSEDLVMPLTPPVSRNGSDSSVPIRGGTVGPRGTALPPTPPPGRFVRVAAGNTLAQAEWLEDAADVSAIGAAGAAAAPAPSPPATVAPESAPMPATPGPSMTVPVSIAPAAEPRPIAVVEVRTHGRLLSARPFTGGTLRVGRARDNELVLVDDRVSRHHGRLTSRQGVVVYTDLRSTNGSFLNGTRIREIVLGSGDVVRLGNSTLTIQTHS